MRLPYDTSDVIDYTGERTRRMRPPPNLGQRERQAFIELVSGCDPRHFRPADLPLICRYVEAAVLAEQAAGEMAAGGAVIDGKVSPWFAVHQSACKTVSVLALRLRLGPQSRQPRAHKTEITATSYYETMVLEGDHDGKPKPD